MLDTGLIDSHATLGINARHADRLQYRKVTTCAVLRTVPYQTMYNTTDGSEVQQMVGYSYGNIPGMGLNNYTYEYNINDVVGNNGYALV